MTTLISGGTGFLGRHIIDRLIAVGTTDLRILGRTVDEELLDLGVEFIEGSLLDEDDLKRAVTGVTRVYHLAGRVERDRSKAHLMYSLHVDGTRMLLDALREHAPDLEKVVIASTSGTVGVGTTPDFLATEESPHAETIARNWPYYLSKIYAERLCFDYIERYEMPLVLMRPTLLLGPGDHRQSSTGDVVLFLKQKVPGVIEGGMSFVDVRDTADAFIAAMDRAEPGDTYLLGAINLTIGDFFDRLSTITGLSAPRVTLPDTMVRAGSKLLGAITNVVGAFQDLDPVSLEMARHYWYIDSAAAEVRLDWFPRPPMETLRDTVDWLQEHHPDLRKTSGPRRQSPPPEWVPPETLEFAEELRRRAEQD